MAEDETAAPPDFGDALRDAVRPTLETAWDMAVRLWWFWLVVGAVLLVRAVLWVVRERRLARSGIYDIDSMDGLTFEQYLRTAFLRLGYKVELTKYRGDYGADLVVRKDGRKIAVQAKRYSKNVGVKAVQEAVAAKGYYDADAALVVSNRHYTAQAKVLARKNDVALWDRDRLTSLLLEARASETPSSLPVSTPAATGSLEAVAVCAACGTAVSEKVRAYCVDNAERFGGAIYCFRHQRRVRPT